MNYRHIYHAGNFADVFKHWIYCLLLEYTSKKNKPQAILETHAGLGCYSLKSLEANKTQEYQQGIMKLLSTDSYPDSFKQYISIVRSFNNANALTIYPGSSLFVKHFLKKDDELHLCELHADDFTQLKSNFYSDKNIHCHHMNGYHGLKAFLPFTQNRGLIFIDPPFEKNNEYDQIIKYLNISLKRFRQGIFTVWYPIKDIKVIQRFYQKLVMLPDIELLKINLLINDLKNTHRLNGCGMIIINPIWQLDVTLKKDLPYLLELFSLSDKSHIHIE